MTNASTGQVPVDTADEAEPPTSRPDAIDVWHWAERGCVLLTAAVASVGLSGLILGMLGAFSTGTALVLAAPPTIMVAWCLTRDRPANSPFGLKPVACAVILVLVTTGFWSIGPSQHVLVNRDPGSYATTALVLQNTGSLRVDQSDTPFGEADAIPEAATYLVGPGQ